MTQYDVRSDAPAVSGAAVAGVTFAGVMMMIIGVFQSIAGLVAILDDNFYVVAPNYTFDIDTTAWGWAHLLLGILLVVTAYYLLIGRAWAVVTAVVLAGLSAIANFFFIPYYPFWSLLVIGLDVWVIWALTRPGIVRET